MIDGRLVGSVRASERDGICHIGRLIVHPDYRRKSIVEVRHVRFKPGES